MEGIEWLVRTIQQSYDSLNTRVKKDHVQYMFQRAGLRQEQHLLCAESKPQQGLAASNASKRSARQGNTVWPLNKISGGQDDRADTNYRPLGEGLSWQVGMLSFGSLLGTGTYDSQNRNSLGSRCSGQYSNFQV